MSCRKLLFKVGGKLAVVMHRMSHDDAPFHWGLAELRLISREIVLGDRLILCAITAG